MGKRIFIIDGNSLLFRAFYATYYGEGSSIMTSSDGTPTNAIFAFGNMMAKILQGMNKGDSIFVAFDADSHTFRKEEFDAYKANRKPAPPELIPQFAISRDMLDAMGIVHYEQPGIEADDIAGTVAKKAAKEGYEVQVYTSDKDYLQLIDENITVNLIRKGLSDIDSLTPESMVEQFGFAPKQIIDYKGLRGDSSDNLPGIPGVGEKTAVKLIAEYGDFDTIIEAAKDGRIKGKVAQNIIDNEEMGRTCYRLATILLDADLPFDLDELLYKGYTFSSINEFCQKFELRQLPTRLPSIFKQKEKDALPVYMQVKSLPKLSDKRIGVYLDAPSPYYHEEEPLGIAIATEEAIYYLDAFDAKVDASLKELLAKTEVKKCLYDLKSTAYSLEDWGLSIEGVDFDTLLAAYLLDSSSSESIERVYSFFGFDLSTSEESIGLLSSNRPEFSAKAAYFSLQIRDIAIKRLKENEAIRLNDEVELPLSLTLMKMEREGFPLDGEMLKQIGESFRQKRDEIEAEVFAVAGKKFNLASPKQIGEYLYGELNLANGKSPGTSVEVLNSFRDAHPVIPLILEYRKYAKLVSTYIDGLLPHLKSDGHIHTYFNQALTSTGRLSSSNPNLQNISTRDMESKEIRKAFYYKDKDIRIASFDYGQIELRILAALSGCKSYIDVFSSDRDVHEETARRIFGVPDGMEVPGLLRRKAKAVNFAIIYGVTPFGLADQIGTTPKEAAALISNFKTHYPEIENYLQSIIKEVEDKGYVKTMLGRRRYLREINDSNYAKREAARRAALNAPVQGSAADLIKVAMLKVDAYLKNGGFKTKMVLQIHDELLFAMSQEEVDILVPKITEIMINALPLPVKLTVDSHVGESWYDAKD